MAKKKRTPSKNVTPAEIESAIFVARGHRVMLDADLARLYGVTTAALNQAVKRNVDRFPDDFAFQVTQQEFTALMSQNVISKSERGGRTKRPWVFTEHGVAMLSSVLRSPTAARVNIEIMRTFVRLRRLMAAPGELVEQLTKLAERCSCTTTRSETLCKCCSRCWRSQSHRSAESASAARMTIDLRHPTGWCGRRGR